MADDRSQRPLLDDAIDRTVRALMDVDARPGFERRVMRRLTGQAASRPVWPRLAATAAALAVILVAALFLRESPRRPGPLQLPSPVVRESAPPAPLAPVVPAVVDRAPSRATRRPARGPRGRRVDDLVVAAGTDPSAADERPPITIAALRPPAALALESIEQRPVNMPDITISTIDIPSLNVEALGPREGRARE